MKSEVKSYCIYCGNVLIKKNIEGRQRLYCQSCLNILYKNPVPATAAVIINKESEVLLVKRATEPKSGRWCLPGGFIELFEEPKNCCLRELKEETGLSGEIEAELGTVLSTHPVYQSVLVIGFTVKNVRGILCAGDDAAAVKYFKLNQRPSLAFKSHEKLLSDSLGHKTARSSIQNRSSIDLFNLGAYVITSGDNHAEIARKACRAGAKIIQYRDKVSSKKNILNTAKEIRQITSGTNTLFLINDYIDVAVMCCADGVHLGQDDIPLRNAREVTPGNFIIGYSTHSFKQAVKAWEDGADYIGIGPVFATPTKQDYIPIGLKTVEQVIKSIKIPVVAIGGLNLKNISQLKDLGIKNFAMVREYRENTEEVVKIINSTP